MGFRGGNRRPRLFKQPGFFIGGPDPRPPSYSESHPAMIGAGCPVLPLETDARPLSNRFSSTGMWLSALSHGFLLVLSL
jgi:hypothetical protein